MLAGTTAGVLADWPVDLNNIPSLADSLENRSKTWKAYQQNYPGSKDNCFKGERSKDFLYHRKHNPFMSFTSISNNPARCANIVNADELNQDIASGNVADFVFFTPNMNNG